ncbi:MAG: ATP-dependent DNA helicase RecG [Methylococcaceae bacterium]|jgi:ATP-dependent DNA helicase RecG
MAEQIDLSQPVTQLVGIGRQTSEHLAKLGIHSILDLLFHLPHRYQDRTRIYPIKSLIAGMSVLICGTVILTDVLSKGRKRLVCQISDGTGSIFLRFFHFSASQFNALKPGAVVSCYADVRQGFSGLEMVHPDYHIIDNPGNCVTEARLTPVYPLTEGLRQSTVRKAVKQALSLSSQDQGGLQDWIPVSILEQYQFPNLKQALEMMHAPDESVSVDALAAGNVPALKRLAFEELLSHYLSMRQAREANSTWDAPVFHSINGISQAFIAQLSFSLTGAQQRVMQEIECDCRQPQAMMRLVQGDVGSGKTVVAAYAALLALSNTYQVAVMAPTELLAEQHFRSFSHWLGGFQTQVFYLSGQLKGNSRKAVLAALADGSAGVVIGTHALFQEQVSFHKLGLIIIDEQHRFGVHQRMALRAKGQKSGLRPHQLVMTATPIPRTLAMLQYADLDISIIDELPPGRKPVLTSVIPGERREEIIARITEWAEKKRQTYWVCTLIEESQILECEAAEKTAEKLRLALPNLRIGLVHGRMKATEKEQVMLAFKQHQLDLLVATTVIEVGVDVPNAGLMIIENAERLGLSQLHQLRGRVGRGDNASFCVLMYQAPLSDTAKHRLGIIRDSNDGFEIAEKDLQLRGAGEVMGTRQTGAVQFKIANLSRDEDLLDAVQQAGEHVLKDAPEAIRPLMHRWLGSDVQKYAEV